MPKLTHKAQLDKRNLEPSCDFRTVWEAPESASTSRKRLPVSRIKDIALPRNEIGIGLRMRGRQVNEWVLEVLPHALQHDAPGETPAESDAVVPKPLKHTTNPDTVTDWAEIQLSVHLEFSRAQQPGDRPGTKFNPVSRPARMGKGPKVRKIPFWNRRVALY